MPLAFWHRYGPVLALLRWSKGSEQPLVSFERALTLKPRVVKNLATELTVFLFFRSPGSYSICFFMVFHGFSWFFIRDIIPFYKWPNSSGEWISVIYPECWWCISVSHSLTSYITDFHSIDVPFSICHVVLCNYRRVFSEKLGRWGAGQIRKGRQIVTLCSKQCWGLWRSVWSETDGSVSLCPLHLKLKI